MKQGKTIKVGIHQPNFFPWLGYFYKMMHADVFVILDTVDIELKSAKAITHRTKVKSNSGKAAWLTLPLDISELKTIESIRLKSLDSWIERTTELIEQYYRNSPNFEDVFSFIKECLNNGEQGLSKYNVEIITRIADRLKIDTKIVLASELPVSSLDRNKRLIEIIQSVNGNCYVSGRGGKKYHDESLFEAHEIQIEYLQFVHPVYPQLHGEFVKGLGSIDYLFNTNLQRL